MKQQVVVIAGAGGGLGSAIARTFARHSAQLVLLARSPERLQTLAAELGDALVLRADVSDLASLEAARLAAVERFGRVDVVINAVGADVRRSFLAHEVEEIRHLTEVNLLGAMWLTRAFLPPMLDQKAGVIAHLGGFADGRLAFPFYSVDSATRAGLRGFIDAMNRELDGSGVTLTYFCPAPADTDAERPYHGIWREMGMRIAAPDEVAQALYRAVERRERIAIMGTGTRLFAALNALSSRLADFLLMRGYRDILQHHLG